MGTGGFRGGEGEGARLGLMDLLPLCIDQPSGQRRGSEHEFPALGWGGMVRPAGSAKLGGEEEKRPLTAGF